MKICSYLRISTLSQRDNTSIESQRKKVEGFCDYNEHTLLAEFVDDGKSASNTNRSAYKDMMNFIRNNADEVEAIVVYKADRIHRSIKNLMTMIDELQELEVDFISLTESFDTSTPQGRLFLQMLGSFSEFERAIINERTQGGRVAKAESGLYSGGTVAFGYRVVNNKFIIHDEEAKIVKEIFKKRSKGMSTVQIAKEHGMSKQRIQYILKNETYIGRYSYNGKKEKNKINLQVPTIISDYMFKKVNYGKLTKFKKED